MSGSANTSEEHRRIDSWKEIAAFFGRDERTVKRWEKERALPVHRLPGEHGGVFAYADELDRWLHCSRGAAEAEPERTVVTHPLAEPQWVAPVSGPAAVEGRKMAPWAPIMAATLAVGVAVGALMTEQRHQLALAGSRAPITHTPDPVAYEFYLKGRYNWNRRTDGSLAAAVDAFTQALVHDSEYAQAYAGLAECYDLMPEYTTMTPSEAFPRAIAAARKAIALDDSLGEAHRALAFALFYGEWKVPEALSEYHRAIALNPQDEEAHHWYATSLFSLGDHTNEALEEIDKAQQLDPASRSILADQAEIRYWNGDQERALATLRELEREEPDFASAPRYLADIDWTRGNDRGWLEQSRRLGILAGDEARLAQVAAAAPALASGGEHAMLEALRDIEQKQLQGRQISGLDLAKTNARLGRKGEAIRALSAAAGAHDFAVLGIASHHADFASLYGDPEFEKVRRQVGVQIGR